MNKLRNLFTALLAVLSFIIAAQESGREFPAEFQIAAADLNHMIVQPEGRVLHIAGNPFVDASKVELNTLNGDMRFVRIKSDYFPAALLTIQVNGPHTTQVFIMSDSAGVFYKGTASAAGVKMEKCSKDDIVVE